MSELHFTHFRACIIEAARAGNPPKIIAADIGSTPSSVKAILSNARRLGVEIPRFRPGVPASALTPREEEVLDALAALTGWNPPRAIGGCRRSYHHLVLQRLTEKGLVEFMRRNPGAKARKRYRITDAGRSALRQQMKEAA